MKKKLWIFGIVVFVILLLVPLSVSVYEDGGTRVYRTLTYTLVDWNRIEEYDSYNRLSLYGPPYAYMGVDELWARETEKRPPSFIGVVREIDGNKVTVEPVEGEKEREISERIAFTIPDPEDSSLYLGCIISVSYSGEVTERTPAWVIASDWSLTGDWRDRECDREWPTLSFTRLGDYDETSNFEGWIAEIYSDKFLLHDIYGYTTLVEGKLGKQWKLADYVEVELRNAMVSDGWETVFKGELLSINAADAPSLGRQEDAMYPTLKPVLYLYPEEETAVNVELALKGQLTCTYPAYKDGWSVTARPDGTLTDAKGQSYNYLYWEGEVHGNMDFSKGFCVAGKDTASFLEWALEELGLTRREANEFIVYWLPQMEDNAYNLIYFQGKSYTDTTELKISPQPDSLIRIYMTWKASEQWVDLPAQELTAPERTGFVAVEWGGVGLPEE